VFKNDEEEALIRVGPGTPSGEVFRRYWLPVECSANLGRDGEMAGPTNPLRVEILGENLVLFRDAKGQPGLLGEHCSHRGTSLAYGRVEEHGLRCIYHGWLYDHQGNCLDTPAEPPKSQFKQTVKQPFYPCVEVGGLIFAYMGPPEKQPLFPRYHQLFREDGMRVTGNGGYVEQCNVFQAMHDNNLDHWHNEIAHSWFRGREPFKRLYYNEDGELVTPIRWERTPWGVRYVAIRATPEPDKWEYHENNTVFPTQRCNFEGARSMKWAVPVNDYQTRWFTVDFFPYDEHGEVPKEAQRLQDTKFHIGYAEDLPTDWARQVGGWWNLEHPWRQGNVWEDEVAQQTQGPSSRSYLPDWEKWRLATSDRGLVITREVWREQIERVRQGLDPIGVVRDPRQDRLIRIPSDSVYDLDWDEAMRLYEMSPMQRMRHLAETEGMNYAYLELEDITG
jgi:phenylpropionate dioxygenase-like ring-hydroxylating dioxygenase large terminal subunit